MKYIALPDEKERRLSFYLAMEEWVARRLDEPECFFMWQVAPTVIFGRNQVMENEVNVDYCHEKGIQMFRRKSGGGCVYADKGNVMLSYVCDGDNVGFTFNKFINMLLLVLRRMGVEATSTSHNDVMIGERKVSGTAFYHLPGRNIVHSTFLYDTDMENMLHAITPSREKLQRKGVESVRQRITLLKDYTDMSLEEVKSLIRTTLCVGERVLTLSEVDEIERLEEKYL
ncbi:MAG: lipoate--protein ligase family protein [Bacteroidaceae bacterium]|jgi:lipoic acid synthetase/lipoate-protein ligase A|nr:lipoate--protein ligase family protein [Bacteroidaceae bacterium]MBR6973749.1 lipoate--protein ligase family protein [Bacteroidaceae bacterium]